METELPQGRLKLSAVVRASGDTIDIDTAADVLGGGRDDATKTLSRWVKQGWLRRVAQGVYVPVSLDALDSERVLEDPWVLVPALYAPAYVGGRTAAEHWDLTEQIFRDVLVYTARRVRQRVEERHGAIFTLKHAPMKRQFGTTIVWRGKTKVAVSDVHRTVVDMLDEPVTGGGIQHVAECLHAYLRRKDRNDEKLVSYADRLDNRAVFRRLGFLLEAEEGTESLREACRTRLSAGTAKLDPAAGAPRLVTRWGLWVPQTWARGPRP